MVGIIVIGLIGGVIAATVFAVIPWAQDNAAKQQLDSVASAQSAYIGLVADQNGAATTFGTGAQLKTQGLFDATAAKVGVGISGTGTAAHYAAAKASASGKVFYISDKKTQPTLQAGGVAGTAFNVTVDLGTDGVAGGTGGAADTTISVTAP
jgi:hypothetical protein